jgi:hypothetical protein
MDTFLIQARNCNNSCHRKSSSVIRGDRRNQVPKKLQREVSEHRRRRQMQGAENVLTIGKAGVAVKLERERHSCKDPISLFGWLPFISAGSKLPIRHHVGTNSYEAFPFETQVFGEEWLSRSSVVRKAWHTSRNHMKQDPQDFPERVVLCHKLHICLKVRCSN